MDGRDRNLVRAASDATVQSPRSHSLPPSPSMPPPSLQDPAADSPSPSSPSSRSSKPSKKSNPLIDLIDTEKHYVDLLTSIIRRVAAAWSKDNFPPPELDDMFRSVEAIYKANRSLLMRLEEIGPSPSSPKALGDLLMKWIDDLQEPYQRYCNSYLTGFDSWPPVLQNVKLPALLEKVSAAVPPAPGGTATDPESRTLWTLDSLFILPRGRLKYYKKLYARLLKSTQPGRSDHRLLVVAVEKLDHLLEVVSGRLQLGSQDVAQSLDPVQASVEGPGASAPVASEGPHQTTEPSRDLPPVPPGIRDLPPPPILESSPPLPRTPNVMAAVPPPPEKAERKLPAKPPDVPSESPSVVLPPNRTGRIAPSLSLSMPPPFSASEVGRGDRGSSNISTPDDSHSESRSSRGTNSTSIVSLGNLPSPADLEKSLSVEGVHDIFTMAPKVCSLQLSPAELSFARSTRASVDISITCTPVTTGVPVETERGHVFLLSDLLLICEKTRDEDKANADAPAMRLVYPPLAGRFIKITGAADDNGNALTVQLLRKVTITFQAESQQIKERFQRDLEECIAFAARVPSAKGGQPKPTPSGLATPVTATDPPPTIPRSNSEPFPTETVNNSRPTDRPSNVNGIASKDTGPAPAQTGAHNSMPSVPSSNGGILSPAGGPRSIDGAFAPYAVQRPTLHMMPGQGHPPYPHGAPAASQSVPFHGYPPHFIPHPSAEFRGRDGAPMGPPYNPTERFGAPPGPVRPFPPPPFGQGPPPFPGSYAPGAPRDPSSYPSPTASSMPPSTRSTILSSRSPSLASSHPSTRRALEDISPPSSPGEERGPAVISAQMKCKVFLKQAHSQWKSLGGAKLKLYQQQLTNVKQLVVEADTSQKTLLISTIVLTDAVERVGKTGVAIELSDKGASTGIVYMIQLRNEVSATGLFNSLLMGSDRTTSG